MCEREREVLGQVRGRVACSYKVKDVHSFPTREREREPLLEFLSVLLKKPENPEHANEAIMGSLLLLLCSASH